MKVEDISMYTDISIRSVQRILAYFKKTGDLNLPKPSKAEIRQSLCDYDVEVSRPSHSHFQVEFSI
jgi:hypothetical protein